MVRNERAIEKLAEEVEDLEDEVQESVSATISGRAKVSARAWTMAGHMSDNKRLRCGLCAHSALVWNI